MLYNTNTNQVACKCATNDFFLIMHLGNSKNKNKALKSKKSNECFAKQISTKMHA